MSPLHEVVLASVSPRRYELLRSLGVGVRVVPSTVDELPRPELTPLEVARAYAAAKVADVAARESRALVVGADTVVDLDGQSLGKPSNAAHAVQMLRALSGRDHRVHTAFVVCDGTTGVRIAADRTTTVTFAPLDDATIEAYVAGGDPLDKAGAYGIQGPGAALVERIAGDFYTVMGFPLGDFIRCLPQLGYELANRAMSPA